MSAAPSLPIQPPVRSTSRARDLVTVALLLGSIVFVVLPRGLLWATLGWAIGAALLWTSAGWSSRDKYLGTLAWPGGLIGPFLLLTRVGQVCTQALGGGGEAVGQPSCTGFALSPWIGVPVALVLIAAPFAVAVHLMNRAGRPG